jgi:arylsulfatase
MNNPFKKLIHAAAFALLVCAVASAPAAERPYFLIVLAEDMGYSDPGCHGGEIDTPNIESSKGNASED